jgi:gamma-glutamyltranspeptidase/glutathione hydrolase
MAYGVNPGNRFDGGKSNRPLVRSNRGVVSSGHMLASIAGLDILRGGGNAIDAGVAAGICLNVVHHDMTTFSGVAPIVIYLAEEQRVVSISGLGRWPKAASLDFFWQKQDALFNTGIAHCVIPAAADAWTTALEKYGTKSLSEVMEAALEYATVGFPVHDFMAYNFARGSQSIRAWSSNQELVAPEGELLGTGETFRQPDLARTFERMLEEERATFGDRSTRIRAARNRFYCGDIAQEFVSFSKRNSGFFTLDDFRTFKVQEEPTVSVEYKGYQLFTCGPWCQGPVFPQALSILKHFDLRPMGHNSPEYLHVVTEALKLAFADREFYYGDPEFVNVPVDGLLGNDYAALRAKLIRDGEAFPELPSPGDPLGVSARRDDYRWPPAGDWISARRNAVERMAEEPDTSYVCAIDANGNMFSATPSDTFTTHLSAPIIPGLGLPLSGRGRQSRLEYGHPAAIAPWKRPRLTPSPALVLKNGKPVLTIGTPGGDVQPQAMLQVFLNIVEFGMELQEAVEAPRIATQSFPGSFYPYHYRPGALKVESGIDTETRRALVDRGHKVEVWSDPAWQAGSVLVAATSESGQLEAAADPRREAVALGW